MKIKIKQLKRLVILLTFAIATFGIAGCVGGADKPESVNSNASTTRPDITTSTSKSEATSDLEENTTGTGTFETNPSATSGTSSKGTTTTTAAPGIVGLSTFQPQFVISLVKYHPGVPGFDVEYEIVATFNNMFLTLSDYTLDVNLDGVRLNGNKVIVPDAVRQQGKTLTINATYKKDPRYKYRLDIALRKWDMTMQDDFNGSSIDGNTWSNFEEYGRGGFNPYSIKMGKNVFTENGHLVLESKKDAETFYIERYPGSEFRYSYGAVSTMGKFYQAYGCFTSKMKLPSKGGILSSFWLLPNSGYKEDGFFSRTDVSSPWNCSEVDIFEHWATSGKITYHTEHFWNGVDFSKTVGNRAHRYTVPDFDVNKRDYIEFSFIWTKYNTYYYVNGTLAATNGHTLSSNPNPGYIILSSAPAWHRPAASGGENINGLNYVYNGWLGLMQDDDFPQRMEVDYVRVYK